jgi:hypothetical protein
MEPSDAAELQVLLEGVDLPAQKAELVRYAAEQRATPSQIGLLAGLPDEEFDTIDAIGEQLAPVQPESKDEVPHEPKEESGDPPGGDAYTQLHPESGAVRA